MSSRDDAILWDVRIRLTLHERGLADDAAVRWWDEPSPALDGRTPIDVWRDDEYERVFESACQAPESAASMIEQAEVVTPEELAELRRSRMDLPDNDWLCRCHDFHAPEVECCERCAMRREESPGIKAP